jgi:V8-like Glu-specific endopeptidase
MGLAGLAAALWGGLAHGNIFASDGRDPRVNADIGGRDAAYAPVGRTISEEPVDMYEGDPRYARVYHGQISGTGFMISPCLMVTNFHTVFGDVNRRPSRGAAHYVRFEVGVQGRHFSHHDRARVVAWGDFARSEAGDWVLAEVEGCPGKDPTVGWFDVARVADTPVGALVSSAGFAGESGRLTLSRDCRIRETSAREVAHDCASSQGDSGAPVLVARGARLAAVALTSGADEDSDVVLPDYLPTYANRAVTLDYVLAAPGVRAKLDADLRGSPRVGVSDGTAAAAP